MGSTYIRGFIDEGFDLETTLKIHLQNNHFPPVHLDFVAVAMEAIVEANNGNCDHLIKMPNGKSLYVSEIIRGLHLGEFLNDEKEYDYE